MVALKYGNLFFIFEKDCGTMKQVTKEEFDNYLSDIVGYRITCFKGLICMYYYGDEIIASKDSEGNYYVQDYITGG